MLCALPAFRAIRRGLPHAEIVLAGLPSMSWLVERFPHYLTGFRPFPGYPGLPEQSVDEEQSQRFFQSIQGEEFDLAVQLHGNGHVSNAVIAQLSARRMSGFFIRGHPCPDPPLFLEYPNLGLEVHRVLTLACFLGFEPDGDELEFPLHEFDFDSLRAATGDRLSPGEYVCLHPGASLAERRWPVKAFIEVAHGIMRRGFQIALTGTQAEAYLTHGIARGLGGGCLDFSGRTEIGALAALIKNARLLICNDTGVSHLAAAVGTPSVVISTGNNTERWAPVARRRHHVLNRDAGLTTADVITHADALLKEFASHVDFVPGPTEMPACVPSVS
jgi:ADP-heptose:LPS heptosyltransferase